MVCRCRGVRCGVRVFRSAGTRGGRAITHPFPLYAKHVTATVWHKPRNAGPVVQPALPHVGVPTAVRSSWAVHSSRVPVVQSGELTPPRRGGGGGLAAVSCHVPDGSCTRMGGICVGCVGCAAMTWRGGGWLIAKCGVTRVVTWVSSGERDGWGWMPPPQRETQTSRGQSLAKSGTTVANAEGEVAGIQSGLRTHKVDVISYRGTAGMWTRRVCRKRQQPLDARRQTAAGSSQGSKGQQQRARGQRMIAHKGWMQCRDAV